MQPKRPFRHASPRRFSSTYLVAFIGFFVAGCDSSRVSKAEAEELIALEPVCADAAQCDAMMAAAEKWLRDHSRTQVVHSTDSLLETNRHSDLPSVDTWFVVEKTLLDSGGYRISATASCSHLWVCKPEPAQAIRDLYQAMAGVK